MKKALTAKGLFLNVHDNVGKVTVEELIFLKELAEAGRINPVIDRTYGNRLSKPTGMLTNGAKKDMW